MTMVAARFVEYLVLLLAISFALVVRDVLPSKDVIPDEPRRRRSIRLAIALGAIGALIFFHLYSMKYYVHYQTKAAPPRFFKGASAWMSRNLAPGETVINLFWDDFPDLFYDAPRQHYLWGLDPTYSLRYDPENATWLERARRQEVPLDGSAMARLFHSNYLILRTGRADRYPELRRNPFQKAYRFQEVYRDNSAVLFRID